MLTAIIVGCSYIIAEGAVIISGIQAAKIACSKHTDTVAEVIMGIAAAMCAVSAVVMPLYWFGMITWETIN